MSKAGPLRLVLRTTADVFIGLILFTTFLLAVSAHERTSVATHRLSGLLSISSSAGELLKFSLDDSPLIAAAVVATAVPVPQSGAFSAPRISRHGQRYPAAGKRLFADCGVQPSVFQTPSPRVRLPAVRCVEGGPGSAGSP